MLLKPDVPESPSFTQRMSHDEYVALFSRIMTVVCPELTPAEQLASIEVRPDVLLRCVLLHHRLTLCWTTGGLGERPCGARRCPRNAQPPAVLRFHLRDRGCVWRRRVLGHACSFLVHPLPIAADIWCDTVEWQEYHEFLGMLYSYIARRGKLIQMEGAWVCFA